MKGKGWGQDAKFAVELAQQHTRVGTDTNILTMTCALFRSQAAGDTEEGDGKEREMNQFLCPTKYTGLGGEGRNVTSVNSCNNPRRQLPLSLSAVRIISLHTVNQ